MTLNGATYIGSSVSRIAFLITLKKQRHFFTNQTVLRKTLFLLVVLIIPQSREALRSEECRISKQLFI